MEQDGPLLSFLAAEKVIRKLVYRWGEKEMPKSMHISHVQARSDTQVFCFFYEPHSEFQWYCSVPSLILTTSQNKCVTGSLNSTSADSRAPTITSITEAKAWAILGTWSHIEWKHRSRKKEPPPPAAIIHHREVQLEHSGMMLLPYHLALWVQLKAVIIWGESNLLDGPDLASFQW